MKRKHRKTVSEEVYDEVYRDVDKARSRRIRRNLLWIFFGLPPKSAGDLRWFFWIGLVGRVLVFGLMVYVLIYSFGKRPVRENRNEDGLAAFRHLSFVESRIPARDALSTYVAEGEEKDPDLKRVMDRSGSSRWYPAEGGHRVYILYPGGEFDADRFELEKGAWDHEHCKACGERIQAMTLCWVTKSGPYLILCDECYKKLRK